MIWGGVIIVYLLNYFFKKSSDDSTSPKEKNRRETIEPVGGPFDEIRREILRKKEERQKLEELETETLEMDTPQAKPTIEEVAVPSQFQVHLEEQSQRIKQKQLEAERLKANLELLRQDKSTGKGLAKSRGSAFSKSSKVSDKVRAVLSKKSDIKAALIAGEIIAQPLALRTQGSSRF